MTRKKKENTERYEFQIPVALKNELAVKAEKYKVDMSVLVRFFIEKGCLKYETSNTDNINWFIGIYRNMYICIFRVHNR